MTKVTVDLFAVAKRLLQINSKYRVFYNNRASRFEVWTKVFEFVVPYDRLDSRTLDYTRKTLRQNADIIEAEINAHNAQIVTDAHRNFDKAAEHLNDMLEYALRTGRTVNFTQNFIKEF